MVLTIAYAKEHTRKRNNWHEILKQSLCHWIDFCSMQSFDICFFFLRKSKNVIKNFKKAFTIFQHLKNNHVIIWYLFSEMLKTPKLSEKLQESEKAFHNMITFEHWPRFFPLQIFSCLASQFSKSHPIFFSLSLFFYLHSFPHRDSHGRLPLLTPYVWVHLR